VIYKEWKDSLGFIYKTWENDLGQVHRQGAPASIKCNPDGSIAYEGFLVNNRLHRELGPAEIWYYPDGSTEGGFWIHGQHLGYKHNGFWRLWERLTDEQRKHPAILKCLVRYS
jgi:hypothetical protein